MNIWGDDTWPDGFLINGKWETMGPKCECGTQTTMGEAMEWNGSWNGNE
jgi:hypothetical protein